MGCCGCYRTYAPSPPTLKDDDLLKEDVSRMSGERILQILENTPAEDLIWALLPFGEGKIVLPRQPYSS